MIDKLSVLEYEKPIADAYAEATRLLVENIARHIASGTALRTAKWEMKKLEELGLLNRENAAILMKAVDKVPNATRQAMEAANRSAFQYISAVVRGTLHGSNVPPMDEMNRQYIEYWMQTAIDKFNMTNTTMLQSAQQAYIRAVNGVANMAVDILSTDQQKAALGTLNAATAGIVSGGLTLAQAKKKAIEDMADEGIYGFVDKAGRHWTPEAYTSMVLRTTVHNVDIQATKSMSQQFGVDVFQCSWHPNSRPSHYDYQGKFYSWNDEEGTFIDGLGEEHHYEPVSNTGYGDAAGLFGINCGHTAFPMDEGVSVPFDPAEIQDREASDKGYAEAQKQRAIERSIRDAKTKAEVYKIAGDTKKAAEWSAKVRDRQATMRQFLKETGRTRSYERERVYGIGGKVEPKPTVPKREVPNPFAKVPLLKDEYKKAMAEMLEKCPNKTVKRMFGMLGDRLVINNANSDYEEAFYDPRRKGVTIGDWAAKGVDYSAPYETFFHEFAHMCDHILGGPDGAYMLSTQEVYGDGDERLREVLVRDLAEFKKTIGVDTDHELVAALKNENMSKVERGNISDILEGLTGINYPLGLGHGADYHKGSEGATEREFFAEVIDSAVAAPKAFEQMKRIFPNAVANVFEGLKSTLDYFEEFKEEWD